MKKGRHRRFEEARALKRSHEVDFEDLFEDINGGESEEHKPEHDAWADVAEEWQSKAETEDGDADPEVDDDLEPADASEATEA